MDYNALSQMTVNQLRDEAKKLDVKVATGMKKDELLASLAEKLDLKIPEKKVKTGKQKQVLDKDGLRKKILVLKDLRKTASGKDGKKQAAILRRRIHLLKRQIKKIA